jgi:hypothetical protein
MNRDEHKMKLFLVGALGGIATNLFRLGIKWVQGPSEIPEITYFLGLMIFAFLGGMMVVIWKETDLKKAFYLGLGLPAALQIGISEIKFDEIPEIGSGIFFNTLYASSPLKVAEDRNLELKVGQGIDKFTIKFSSEDSTISITYNTIPKSSTIRMTIPIFAKTMMIFVDKIPSNKLDISGTQDDPIIVQIKIEENSWYGLKEAFGVKNLNRYTIILQKL